MAAVVSAATMTMMGQTMQPAQGVEKALPAHAAPARTRPTAREQLEALQKKYDDFGGLNRYAEDDAKLSPFQPGRVVFFGDSITDAWTRNGGTFFPGKPYLNRGISGQTTEQMLVRFRQDVVHLHPRSVVILAGTNDIAGNTGVESLTAIMDNLKSMTDLARVHGIRVILASVLPTVRYPWKPEVTGISARIRELNARIEQYCKQERIVYLDYYSAMAGQDGAMKPGISIDGVHPNAAGYAIMEPLAEQALAK
jgi:lysophospholipase L1-like esterase